MSGPEKVHRETCERCQWQGMPEECATCLVPLAYECIDEYNKRTNIGDKKSRQQ